MEQMTKEWAKGIVDEWNEFYDNIERGEMPDKFDGGIFDNGDYIDRYFWGETSTEYCVTTWKDENKTYLSDRVIVAFEDGDSEPYDLYELLSIIEDN